MKRATRLDGRKEARSGCQSTLSNRKAPIKKPVLSELMEPKILRHPEMMLSNAKDRETGGSDAQQEQRGWNNQSLTSGQ
jgi:hypothetical protein